MTSPRHTIALVAAIVLLLSGGSLAGEHDMQTAKAWIDKGMLQREAGKTGSTESFTQARLLLDGYINAGEISASDLARAYELRARCQNLLGDNEQALGDLDRAIALSSDKGHMYYLRSSIHDIMGNDRAALADLRTSARKGYEKARGELTARGLRW